MKKEKTVIILTDDLDSTKNMADDIALALYGNKITVQKASGFDGTALLAADVVFIGCGEPDPPSFSSLSKVLAHINLAGRPCGLFSPAGAAAIDFLTAMIKDSELIKFVPDKEEFAAWAKTVVEYER